MLTHSYTYSGHLSDAACRSIAINFQPSGAQVYRYVRTVYEARKRFSYTPDGKPSRVSRDAGRGAISSTFGYDTLGRKIWQNDADSGNVQYQYNALGELIVQTDAQGNQIRNQLDGRGRVWQQQAMRRSGSNYTQESVTQWTYDTLVRGALSADSISGQTGNQSHVYAYDSLGR